MTEDPNPSVSSLYWPETERIVVNCRVAVTKIEIEKDYEDRDA